MTKAPISGPTLILSGVAIIVIGSTLGIIPALTAVGGFVAGAIWAMASKMERSGEI